ncbi:ATP phosphoribosyltransferase regulatory subunit, partial [uncultured Enorma sp.]|uniref:ATP phosphoribosyltransferase regulatory subunit n=1 Tax=uncultured Enorma sp. TaxID=1714346 RepID=UPI002806539F
MNTTPWGFRDILPEEAQVREEIAAGVRACFKARGYLPVETPLLEDPRALAGAGRAVDTPFKLFDDDGRLLAVRSDNTLPIVRLVAARLRDAELPLRLRYEAPLVRSQPRNVGAARQFTQLGFELIGLGGVEGDAEMLELVIDVLRALDLPSWRIVAGSVRPFMKLLACAADEALARDVLELVHANDFVDLDARIAEANLAESLQRAISELPRLHGGVASLDRVDALLAAAGIAEPQTDELRALADRFAVYSAQGALSFDFSIMNSFDYYTGLVFKAYAI